MEKYIYRIIETECSHDCWGHMEFDKVYTNIFFDSEEKAEEYCRKNKCYYEKVLVN